MRCGVYVRVSTDDQKDNGYSIDSQLRMVKEYCEKVGFSANVLQGFYQQLISGNLYYIAFPNKNADGLRNDLDTQGVPVLKVTSEYTVIETEFTRLFLT